MKINEDTRKKLVAFLYKQLEDDNTCVEFNELLDILEAPKEITLTDESGYALPVEFTDSVNEYLSDKYGRTFSSCGIEIKLTDITWEGQDE